MKANNLFEQFLSSFEIVEDLKKRKYEQMRGYYRKHYGKETFRTSYYEELKSEFEKILTLDDFFNLLSEDAPLLFVVAGHLRTAKKERENGQPIELVRLEIPLVPTVKNLHLFYLADLTTKGGRYE